MKTRKAPGKTTTAKGATKRKAKAAATAKTTGRGATAASAKTRGRAATVATARTRGSAATTASARTRGFAATTASAKTQNGGASGKAGNGASLLVVGSVGLDTIETATTRRAEVLGGAASYFAVAASFLTRVPVHAVPRPPLPVRLVAVVGDDFPARHTALFGEHRVELDGLERVPGRTFRWTGRYSPDFVTRTTLDTQLNVFQDFRPKLPDAWRASDFVFLANIDPVLQLSVLDQVRRPRFVACDTMNFWIEGKREALGRLLRRVDLLLLNDEEARQLAGVANLPAAARAIRAMGPHAVVIKRGDAGALLFHEAGVFAAPAFPIENVVDPTGAGDSFAGGFMGWLARAGNAAPQTVRTAMIMGSVLASFAVEDFSLDRFRTLELTDVRARFAAFADLVHFEKIRI